VRCQLVNLDLAELADVADALALERAEVGRDARRLEVDDAGEGLVQETANGQDWEVAGFGLMSTSAKLMASMAQMKTYSQGVDHGLETKIDLASANDFGHILEQKLSVGFSLTASYQTHAGVVGLKQGDLDAFVLEVALGLSQVKRSVIRRSVPGPVLILELKREESMHHTSWSGR
jgi:hypothetical protein